MVCGEMIAPLALTLHTQPVRYCLHCHLNEYSVYLWFHHLVFRLECEAFAAMPDLMSKNYATFYIAVQESQILNRNVQSLFTVSNRIIIISRQKLPPAPSSHKFTWLWLKFLRKKKHPRNDWIYCCTQFNCVKAQKKTHDCHDGWCSTDRNWPMA